MTREEISIYKSENLIPESQHRREKIREGITGILIELRNNAIVLHKIDALPYLTRIQELEDSQGVVIKVDRDKNNKYPLAEFYTSKMPTCEQGFECSFVESLIKEGYNVR